MYVRSLQIKNLRCFRSAEAELQFPGREMENPLPLSNVNLLLGSNGAGKTTILKAIALAVLGRVLPGSGFVPYRLVRRERRHEVPLTARVEADLLFHDQDFRAQRPLMMTGVAGVDIRRIHDQEDLVSFRFDPTLVEQLYDDESPAVLVVGYGSTRWAVDSANYEPPASQRKRRRLRYQRVAGLFEEHIGLTPLTFWLPRLEAETPDRFTEVCSLMNDLLPSDTKFLGEMEEDEYLFDHCGVPVPLGALSDGYRAYVGWISDLLYNISLGTPEGTRFQEARGVVLVDEVDLHLHPEWQREVVPTIARSLPNLQFVLTTHSPIVAGTLSAQNIFVLEMDGAGASTIGQLTEPIHGLNTDQILVSSYFNLDTTRAPEAVDELNRLSEKAMQGDSQAALAFLRRLNSGTEPPR